MTSPRETLLDLAEDLDTSWIPDVVGRGDFVGLAAAPALTAHDVTAITVPKPSGDRRAVHQLSVRALAQLHEVCGGVATAIDARLASTVCGYRRGAEAGSAYSSEFRRYSEIGTGFAGESEAVLAADVEDFFAHVDPDHIVQALRLIADDTSAEQVGAVFDQLRRYDVVGLAAGYSDMRMLANLLLAEVDDVVGMPFVRWVDDYRIFLPSAQDAAAVTERIDAALAKFGLRLSKTKTRVWKSDDAAKVLFARQFASVYHPGEEPPAVVRAALRSVFLDAVGQEQIKRRELRFALPRMAEVGDDFAVDFCTSAFNTMPWEAPRFVAYLTAFVDVRPDLAMWTSDALRHALDIHDDWLAVRLMPLAARVKLDDIALDSVAEAAARTRSGAVWGHCVRLLGVQHRARDVYRLVEQPADRRAAVAALLDVDAEVPRSLRVESGAITFECSGGSRYPTPAADTLL